MEVGAEARGEDTEQVCQFWAPPRKVPGYWDGRYEAVYNAVFFKAGVYFCADIRQLRWQAAEEYHVGPGRQISVIVKAPDPQLLELLWEG